jgi:hypothetical protein
VKYYSEKQTKNLRLAFEEGVLSWPEVSTKKMFGCPCYKVKNKLFAFFVTKGIVITQLTQAEREKLSRLYHATPFRAGKKTVRNWVRVSLADVRDLTRIMPYVQRSYDSSRAQVKKDKK